MCDLILVAYFIIWQYEKKSSVREPYVSGIRVRKMRVAPLEKRTWNEANAATNAFSPRHKNSKPQWSYDKMLIVWFNLVPRVLSYKSFALQGRVGEDPCD